MLLLKSGGVVSMDRKAQTGRSLPGVGGHVEFIKPVPKNQNITKPSKTPSSINKKP